MRDFNENVLPGTHWPIDKGIAQILIDINKNPNVQTLYSKKCQCIDSDENSYIQFCYFQKCELEIFQKIIPNFISAFNTSTESRLGYLFYHPKSNANYHADKPKRGISCIDDKDYFLVNNIKIEINSFDKQKHDIFWDEILKTFRQLGL